MSAIHDLRDGPLNEKVSNGYYAVDPSGHVVLVPPLQKLKDGFRLASQADIDACRPGARMAARVEAAMVDEPAPESVDEHEAEPVDEPE